MKTTTTETMITAPEALNLAYQNINRMRQEGEFDARDALNMLTCLRESVEAGKTVEEIKAEDEP